MTISFRPKISMIHLRCEFLFKIEMFSLFRKRRCIRCYFLFLVKWKWPLQMLFWKQLLLCFPFSTFSSFRDILSEHPFGPVLDKRKSTHIKYTLPCSRETNKINTLQTACIMLRWPCVRNRISIFHWTKNSPCGSFLHSSIVVCYE